MVQRYSLTFDIDWAPDYAIALCLDMLDIAGCHATFFATHQTPLNQEIVLRGHNLGIHPNFLPLSSHGESVSEIIGTCLEFAPNAWCMRSHALVQSTPLLCQIFRDFPQLKLDVSLLMHQSSFVHKVRWNFNGVSFDRLLYNWEDDAHFAVYCGDVDPQLFWGETTVFDFHPMHIFLNSTDGREYRMAKRRSHDRDLSKLKFKDACDLINNGTGTRSYFERVLRSGFQCIGLDDI